MQLPKFGTGRAGATISAAQIAARGAQQERDLQILWWLWRHHFLAAKRLQLQVRRDGGST